MNSIPNKQSEDIQKKRLAAQRVIYTKGKRVLALRMILSGILPIIFSQMHAWQAQIALASLFVLFINKIVLERWEHRLKKKAAAIQEQFDCDVLELPWPNFHISDKPDQEDVVRNAKQYKADDLNNWYPIAVRPLPIENARILCQYSNFWWSKKHHKTVAMVCSVMLVIFGLGAISFALAKDLLVGEMLIMVVPWLPIVDLLIDLICEHKDAYDESLRLKKEARKLWDESLENSEEMTVHSRMLQDQLYEFRSSCPLVFDWMYNLFRDRHEREACESASDLVEEAKEKLGIG